MKGEYHHAAEKTVRAPVQRFVDLVAADGALHSERIYSGDSEFSARQALAHAILDYPGAYMAEMRRDFDIMARVRIEHPPNLLL